MPVPATADDLLALVRRSGLVAPEQLESFLTRLSGDVARPEPGRLASLMVQAGLLTILQAGLLLRGKWKNFVICGKYRLLEHLGTSCVKHVFLCEHLRLHRLVAIKILPPEKSRNPTSLKRFDREARAVAALNHPNIVRAHDIDQEGALHFLVMEYVEGTNLDDLVTRWGPLSLARAGDYVFQAAAGLQHAHEAGLVHRDVKPSNLLVDRSGTVKLLDLGLARVFGDQDLLTAKLGGRSLIGTADYLAPEQAVNGHDVDIRADIYSLGCTFYFLLTGRSPHAGDTVAEKLLSLQMDVARPVRWYRPGVPDGLARVLDRMIARDPARRFATPADVMTALQPWRGKPAPPPAAREMPRHSLAVRKIVSRPARPAAVTRPDSVLPAVARPRKPVHAAAAGVVLAFGAGGLGWYAWPDRESPLASPVVPAATIAAEPTSDFPHPADRTRGG